jgi:hypothetical protein
MLRIRFAGRACIQRVVKGALSGDSHCGTGAVWWHSVEYVSSSLVSVSCWIVH